MWLALLEKGEWGGLLRRRAVRASWYALHLGPRELDEGAVRHDPLGLNWLQSTSSLGMTPRGDRQRQQQRPPQVKMALSPLRGWARMHAFSLSCLDRMPSMPAAGVKMWRLSSIAGRAEAELPVASPAAPSLPLLACVLDGRESRRPLVLTGR